MSIDGACLSRGLSFARLSFAPRRSGSTCGVLGACLELPAHPTAGDANGAADLIAGATLAPFGCSPEADLAADQRATVRLPMMASSI